MGQFYYGIYISSRCDRVEILDSTKSSVLYSAQIQKRQLQLSLFRPSERTPCEELIALVTFHRFSSRVDIRMSDGRQLNTHRRHLSSTHRLKTEKFRWSWRQERLTSRNFSLIDDEGSSIIAKLTQASSPSGRQLGNIITFENYKLSVIDVIVVTGLLALGYRWLDGKMSTSAVNSR